MSFAASNVRKHITKLAQRFQTGNWSMLIAIVGVSALLHGEQALAIPPSLTIPDTTILETTIATARGFKPNTAYNVNDVDAVSPANGNLVIDVPLGGSYSVGPMITYSFNAIHNSRGWNSHTITECWTGGCSDSGRNISVPEPSANAGLGWSVHMGALYQPLSLARFSGPERAAWPNQSLHDHNSWLYVGSDGSATELWSGLEGRSGDGHLYSKDGSNLRMTQSNDGKGDRVTVEQPNGIKRIFRKATSWAGTICPRNDFATCWRLKKIEDPWGNWVKIDYFVVGNIETWTITDSVMVDSANRTHKLTFSLSDADRAGNDYGTSGAVSFKGQGNDELGDLKRVLKSVVLAGPPDPDPSNPTGRHEVRYVFSYQNQIVERSCPNFYDGQSPEIRVPVLASIQATDRNNVPLAGPYVFQHSASAGAPPPDRISKSGGNEEGSDDDAFNRCNTWSGLVESFTTPLGAVYEYDYGRFGYPAACHFQTPPDGAFVPIYAYTIGVRERRVKDRGLLLSRKSYSTSLYTDPRPDGNGNQDIIYFGPDCSRDTYRISTVDTHPSVTHESGTREEYHASVFVGHRTFNRGESNEVWKLTDVGLPINKNETFYTATDQPPLFLSQRSYECSANFSSCDLRRSQYVRYAMDINECESTDNRAFQLPGSCWQQNPHVVASATVYDSDARGSTRRFKETVYLNEDGLGQFRRVENLDSFDANGSGEPIRRARRYATADYSANGLSRNVNADTGYYETAAPAHALPSEWIFGESDSTTVQTDPLAPNSRRYHKALVFDQGRVACERVYTNHGPGNFNQTNAKDVTTVITQWGSQPGVNAGLVTEAVISGGELGTLGGGACAQSGQGNSNPDNRQVIALTYAHGQPAEIKIVGEPRPLERADIDPATGMAVSSYDETGLRTDIEFDSLNRPVTIRPNTDREATIRFAYASRGLGSSTNKITVSGGLWSEVTFDALGRDILTRRKTSSSEAPTGFLAAAKSYDGHGRLHHQTIWDRADANFSNVPRTVFRKYDILGRPRETVYPDDSLRRFVYRGDRVTQQRYTRDMGEAAERWVQDETIFDSLGRAVTAKLGAVQDLDNPSFYIDPTFTEEYAYDPFGKRLSSHRIGADGQQQIREWDYDARGNLLSERIPEIGTAGGYGQITFVPNISGLPTRYYDGQRQLQYSYDNYGRRTETTAIVGGVRRSMEESTYCEHPCRNNAARNMDVLGAEDTFNPWDIDRRVGRITAITRHNWRRVGSAWRDFPITERYQYRDGHGAPTFRYMDITMADSTSYTFLTESAFNENGQMGSIVYPTLITPRKHPWHGLRFEYSRDTSELIASDQLLSGDPIFDFIYYNYNRHGDVEEILPGNHGTIRYLRDPTGMPRVARITASFENGRQPFDSGTYEYDGSGNIKSIGGAAKTASYDSRGRLTDYINSLTGWSESYVYDSLDNVAQRTRTGPGYGPTTHNYIYGNARASGGAVTRNSRLLRTDGAAGGPPAPNNRYDNSGNLTSVADRWSFLYDPMGAQIGFEDTLLSGAKWEYYYGPGNLRVYEHGRYGMDTIDFRDLEGRRLSRWEYNGDTVPSPVDVLQRDVLGNPVLRYFGELNNPGYTIETFQVHDHLGSLRAHDLRWDYDRDFLPYGHDTEGPSPPETPDVDIFAGLQRDSHGFTDYAQARTYVFPLARFGSPDPARDGWNQYAYASNNPLGRVDPTGLSDESSNEEQRGRAQVRARLAYDEQLGKGRHGIAYNEGTIASSFNDKYNNGNPSMYPALKRPGNNAGADDAESASNDSLVSMSTAKDIAFTAVDIGATVLKNKKVGALLGRLSKRLPILGALIAGETSFYDEFDFAAAISDIIPLGIGPGQFGGAECEKLGTPPCYTYEDYYTADDD